jgi:hypothetical protein
VLVFGKPPARPRVKEALHFLYPYGGILTRPEHEDEIRKFEPDPFGEVRNNVKTLEKTAAWRF